MNTSLITCRDSLFSLRIFLTRSESLSILIGLSIASPIILVSNLILIVSLIKTKQLRNASNVLLLVLSLSDCFIGLITIPLEIVLFSTFKKYPACTLEYTAHATAYFTTHFSGYLIAVISFQRNVQINPNLKQRNMLSRFLVTKAGLTLLVIVIFLVNILETYISVIFYSESLARLMLVVTDAVIFVYIYISYFCVYFKVWNFSKQNLAKRVETQTNVQGSPDRLARTVALILLSAAVCYLPYMTLVGLRREMSLEGKFYIYLSLILVFLNSAVNAVIIMCRSTEIRNVIISSLRDKSGGSSDTLQRPRSVTLEEGFHFRM